VPNSIQQLPVDTSLAPPRTPSTSAIDCSRQQALEDDLARKRRDRPSEYYGMFISACAVTVTSLDSGPSELRSQLPLRARVMHRLVSPDEFVHTVVEVERPFTSMKNGTTHEIRYAIVTPSAPNTFIHSETPPLDMAIAYVIDESQAHSSILDLAMIEYVGAGVTEVE